MSGAWWGLVIGGLVVVGAGVVLFFVGALMEGGIIRSGVVATGARAQTEGASPGLGAILKAIVKAFVDILKKSWKIIFSTRKTIRPGQRLEAAGSLLTVIGLLYLLGIGVAAVFTGTGGGGTTTGETT